MSTGQMFIDSEYAKEDEKEIQAFEESLNHAVSIRIPVRTVALLDGLAKRFGISRNAVVSDFLFQDVEDAFKALKAKDRLMVAEVADEVQNSLYEKNDAISSSFTDSFVKQAKLYNRIDAKRLREEKEVA